MPSTAVFVLRTATALDAAPVIATVLNDLPPLLGTPLSFTYRVDSITADLENWLTPDQRNTVSSILADHFMHAGWGFSHTLQHGTTTTLTTHLTHPTQTTLTGHPATDTRPVLLSTTLAAFVNRMTNQDTIDHLTQPLSCPEATVIADLLDVLGHQDAANTWRTQHAAADPDTACTLR
ncbi:hypothetical protein [Kitasatospora sp. NPDC087315]|uniref:hypothetical protein n=1 Tax=Kitasatospora sp. NPDC087315 TaxID=3364069 RepID=UPI00382770AC